MISVVDMWICGSHFSYITYLKRNFSVPYFQVIHSYPKPFLLLFHIHILNILIIYYRFDPGGPSLAWPATCVLANLKAGTHLTQTRFLVGSGWVLAEDIQLTKGIFVIMKSSGMHVFYSAWTHHQELGKKGQRFFKKKLLKKKELMIFLKN